ncbi:MAG: hypothetical protein UE295_12485 [Acutalibacteraceae bacterium]|nr:hypothetical protein [Acutalibacteraceae bacterium]
MAFKILSSDEIELLTEEQRKSYENELEIYNERVKFVEQLEKLENTVVEPYEPKLVKISAVKKAPNVAFVKPEYTVDIIDVDISSAPEMSKVKFDKPVTAMVPKCSKTKNVSVGHIKKVEYDKPIMPQTSQVVVPDRAVEKLNQNKPSLPQVKGTNIPTKVHIELKQDKPVVPVKIKIAVPCMTHKNSGQVKPNLPEKVRVKAVNQMPGVSFSIDKNAIVASNVKKTAPKVNLPEVVLPEKANPILPKSSVKFAEIKGFKGIDRKEAVLPKAIIPNQVNASFKQANKTKAELPVVSNISVKKASVKKIDVKKAELPSVQKTGIPKKEFAKSACDMSDLPAVNAPKTNVEAYSKPEFKKLELPKVDKPIVNTSGFLKKTTAEPPKIEYPTIDIVPKKTFKKIDSRANNVPSVGGVVIPNAYTNESLKKLLDSNKENKMR